MPAAAPLTTTPTVPFMDLSGLHSPLSAQLTSVWDDVLTTGRFIGGPEVERFEREWAHFCGTEHAVGVSSGTDALRLALEGLGIGSGAEVLVPTNTFVATVEAIISAGCVPRFLDVDPDTLLVTAAGVQAALSPRTAAVMVVHLYGQMPDMDAILAITRRAGIALIEDAAQAHGASWNGRRAGSWGHAGCFSFYPAKNLGALGDGGALVTNDPALAGRVRALADHGRPLGSWHEHHFVGGTSRLDALQAAVLSVKLAHLEAWNRGRQWAADRYERGLDGSSIRPLTRRPEALPVHHLLVVQADRRDDLRARLREQGIETGIHYPIPVHQQPAYSRFRTEPLPIAEAAAGRILSLPLFPHIGEAQIEQVVRAVKEAGW